LLLLGFFVHVDHLFSGQFRNRLEPASVFLEVVSDRALRLEGLDIRGSVSEVPRGEGRSGAHRFERPFGELLDDELIVAWRDIEELLDISILGLETRFDDGKANTGFAGPHFSL
jgi:hypothetical protein